MADLGRWLTESYRVPEATPGGDTTPEPPPEDA